MQSMRVFSSFQADAKQKRRLKNDAGSVDAIFSSFDVSATKKIFQRPKKRRQVLLVKKISQEIKENVSP